MIVDLRKLTRDEEHKRNRGFLGLANQEKAELNGWMGSDPKNSWFE